jgi:hypothetical protein
MQVPRRQAKFGLFVVLAALVVSCAAGGLAQAPSEQVPQTAPAVSSPAQAPQIGITPAPDQGQAGVTQSGPAQAGGAQGGPIAIVSLDSKDPGSAALVTGALQVANGRAMIATNGAITAGASTTDVTLPHR